MGSGWCRWSKREMEGKGYGGVSGVSGVNVSAPTRSKVGEAGVEDTLIRRTPLAVKALGTARRHSVDPRWGARMNGRCRLEGQATETGALDPGAADHQPFSWLEREYWAAGAKKRGETRE